jgi:anthranilate synthase component 1
MDLNILIRTLVQNGRHIRLRAGGGIVADSDPQRELRETQAKAQGLLAALTGSAP